MPTAVVIDGAYFLRRFKSIFPLLDASRPSAVCHGIAYLTGWHLAFRCGFREPWDAERSNRFKPEETADLYRVFFYDCPPLTKKVHYPVTGKSLDLSKTDTAKFRLELHRSLQQVRKVAVRLGRLNEDFSWRLKKDAWRAWIGDEASVTPTDDDFEIDVVQKGVDMRLGLDVAAMAFKRQVDQIVLVAADGDFVPAAKLARREGIDVVLDPMGGRAAQDLIQHVDGVRTCNGASAAMTDEAAS
jgi:uncharacterized LabA/DUF88 family protein